MNNKNNSKYTKKKYLVDITPEDLKNPFAWIRVFLLCWLLPVYSYCGNSGFFGAAVWITIIGIPVTIWLERLFKDV